MDAGQSGSHTFDTAGTFSYICTPHPNMKGTVVVQAAQSGSGEEPDTGDAAPPRAPAPSRTPTTAPRFPPREWTRSASASSVF